MEYQSNKPKAFSIGKMEEHRRDLTLAQQRLAKGRLERGKKFFGKRIYEGISAFVP